MNSRIVRGESVTQLEQNIDHIDLLLTFEHIFNHENFWKVCKVIHTPEPKKSQSLTQPSIHSDPGVSGKHKPKVLERYSDQTGANANDAQVSKRKANSSANASGRKRV